MNYVQLRAFHAAARENGFTAAARRLNLTQPAITLQIKALERTYGVGLFDRRGRTIALTETGRKLYALTRRLFGLEDEIHDLLASTGQLHRGVLRVGADSPYFVIRLLAAFRSRYRDIDISVVNGNSDRVRMDLINYETEVAIIAELEPDSRFRSLELGRMPVVAFVPVGHAWTGRKTMSINELHGRTLIRREPGSATRRVFERELARRGIEPDFTIEVGSRESVQEAVAKNLGIGIVTEQEIVRDARIHIIPFSDADIYTSESLVCLQERRNMPMIEAFWSIAESQALLETTGAEP